MATRTLSGMRLDAKPAGTGNAPPPARGMRDELLALADGTTVRLGDLPTDELRELSRRLRRLAEHPTEEP